MSIKNLLKSYDKSLLSIANKAVEHDTPVLSNNQLLNESDAIGKKVLNMLKAEANEKFEAAKLIGGPKERLVAKRNNRQARKKLSEEEQESLGQHLAVVSDQICRHVVSEFLYWNLLKILLDVCKQSIDNFVPFSNRIVGKNVAIDGFTVDFVWPFEKLSESSEWKTDLHYALEHTSLGQILNFANLMFQRHKMIVSERPKLLSHDQLYEPLYVFMRRARLNWTTVGFNNYTPTSEIVVEFFLIAYLVAQNTNVAIEKSEKKIGMPRSRLVPTSHTSTNSLLKNIELFGNALGSVCKVQSAVESEQLKLFFTAQRLYHCTVLRGLITKNQNDNDCNSIDSGALHKLANSLDLKQMRDLFCRVVSFMRQQQKLILFEIGFDLNRHGTIDSAEAHMFRLIQWTQFQQIVSIKKD